LLGYEIRSRGMMKENLCQSYLTALRMAMMT
jgi:hypothetical protein